MQGRRHERVRELLKRELSAILLREFPVAQVGLISVNEVVLSGDLKSATAYVGLVGTPEQRKMGFDQLVEHRARLRGLLGHAVTLKYTPDLRFVMDDAIARGNRVLQVLDEIEHAAPDASP
jgi:ribosome-binding factor A